MRIGDRVKCISEYDYNPNIVNKIGTILGFKNSSITLLAIKFDENVKGHSCKGGCKAGYGWNLPKRCLVKLEPETAREKVMF